MKTIAMLMIALALTGCSPSFVLQPDWSRDAWERQQDAGTAEFNR